MAEIPTSPVSPDFLMSGTAYLKQHPDFTLVGRKDELNAALDVLARKPPRNNLILSGRQGVGRTSLVMGLQAAMTGKSFFYLDVDGLLGLGDAAQIKEGFQKALDTLRGARNPVLVIRKTRDLLAGLANKGAGEILNTLTKELGNNTQLQTIFMPPEDDAPALQKANEDFERNFIRQNLKSPSTEDLRAIVEQAAAKMGERYGVAFDRKAIDSALDLTSKYDVEGQPQQPQYSLNLLEGAITAAQRAAKEEAGARLEEKLAAIDAALEQGKPAEGDLAGKSPEELAAIRKITEEALAAAAQEQEDIARAKAEMDRASEKIRELKDKLDLQEKKDREVAEANDRLREEVLKQYNAAAGNAEKQAAIEIEYLKRSADKRPLTAGGPSMEAGDLPDIPDSPEYGRLEKRLADEQESLKNFAEKFDRLTKKESDGEDGNDGTPIILTEDNVLDEFSRLSRLPMSKLKEDESQKLLDLERNLGERVVGQERAIKEVSKAVRRARAGLKDPKMPDGVFLFLGPPGVGKTELCKALSDYLGYALNFIDMSQYSQPHTVSGLIGAAPGLVGYDKEGELTRKVRANPKCIVLLDEAEKADPEIYNVLLHPLNEGVIQDNKGNEVPLNNVLFTLTSNLGSEFFLEEGVSYQEAAQKAEAAVRSFFRPEFIRRLDGIICFNKLENDQIEIIAAKSLKNLNGWLGAKGKDLTVEMASEDDLKKMCAEKNDIRTGASSIMKYIQNTITSEVSDQIIENPDSHGTMKVHYTPTGKMSPEDIAAEKSNISVDPPDAEKPAPQAPANQNNKQRGARPAV